MNPNTPGIPSSLESISYYYGLPSKPALVARSSTELWVEPRGPEAYLTAKELKPVGPHALDAIWESVVASAIEAYLTSQEVAFTSVDPARIGYVGSEFFPVIIWVGVVPGSLSGAKGVEVAVGCRAILTDHGITNVHVEIRSSEAILQAKKLYKPVRTVNPTAKVIEPLATTLGLSICGTKTPNLEGTGGFFFTDSKRPGKLFLLTARHTLFHPDHTDNKHYSLRHPSEKTTKVLLFSDDAFQKHVESIKWEISTKQILLTQLTRRKRAVEGQDDDEAEEDRTEVECLENNAKKAITALQKLLDEVIHDWTPPANRAIGHVVLSPPLGCSVKPDGYTEDWAVVEINSSRIDKTNFVGNCIDLGTSVSVEEFTSWMCPHPTNSPSFKYPGSRLLDFLGFIPDEQMAKPDNKTLDHDQGSDTMVIKRGSASGLTVGHLNTLRSVVRYYFEGKPGQSSREVAVYPRNSKSGAFSEPGDSGAAVIDGKGRVAGILIGGAGTTESFDCTYVTSINFIIKRLQEHGYEPDIFPTADNL
ncbi:hypothetical protein RhiJN_21339 [Ceratobasidium sp. AG-Ba]|nr:hypothetical protein RhiJN_21339 [Ceratobasidium sp. AG-Ba]